MKKSQSFPETRPDRLDNAPLDWAPENEQGVVFLFSSLARKRFGLRVERIQAGFPDCIAYKGNKRVRIEFEYRSRNFAVHRHDATQCDWIVCWIDDWPGRPDRLEVKELRKEFGLGWNVWFQPVRDNYAKTISEIKASDRWSVPSSAGAGDLLLFYSAKPDMFVRDVFRVAGPVKHVTARWKAGKDWMAPIKRVCVLKAPLHLVEMQRHPILGKAGFVRGQMRGRYCATQYWQDIRGMITSRNPSLASKLNRFGDDVGLGS